MIQALLIGLVVVIGHLDYFVGTAMFSRPIVLGALVGIFLGDIPTGVTVGFQLELAFMGVQMVGAAVPPNTIVGATLGTAFAITMGAGTETALTIAMPIAMLGAVLDNVFFGVITPIWARGADKCAAEDNPAGITAVLYSNGIFRVFLYGVVCAAAFMLGSDAVQVFVDSIPEWLTNGISLATGILPALGFAQLVAMISTKELAVFFFLGFLLSAYLGIPTIGIVCFSVVMVGILLMVHTFIPAGQGIETEANDDNEF